MSTNLKEAGYRYVYANGRFSWAHQLEMPSGATDCTDMDDADFMAFYLSTCAA